MNIDTVSHVTSCMGRAAANNKLPRRNGLSQGTIIVEKLLSNGVGKR